MNQNTPHPAQVRRETLVDLLVRHGDAGPDRPALCFLRRGEEEVVRWTYGDLDRRARSLAAMLVDGGATGRPVLLVYDPGVEFAAAFLACLYAGAIAVTTPFLTPGRSAGRIAVIAADARPCRVLTTAALRGNAAIRQAFPSQLAAVEWIGTDALDGSGASRWSRPDIDGETLAFLQYTSGSTTAPRGVAVSHTNLLANLGMIRTAFGHDGETRMVSWLPLFHDMGLVGGLLQPLFVGGLGVLMSPLDFMQKPIRWLRAIERYRATSSGGPNFAYELCAERIPPEQAAELDLGSWRVAFCGAEPVRAHTLGRFRQRFASSGFQPGALFPCYGLAEATLFVSGGPAGSGMRVLDDTANGRAAGATPPVGCGIAAAGSEIAIVDPQSRARVPPGGIGEVWVAGPHVARGYWRREEEGGAVFAAHLAGGEGGTPYLRTGDLGRLVDGCLYITGRLKDLIIIRGRSHHPEDLEATILCCHPALAGGGAAFTVDHGEGEVLVILQEVARSALSHPDLAALPRRICGVLSDEHGLHPHEVLLLRPGALPRTSSHKIQRGRCRQAYLEGTLAAL